jgi:hypothetical protein
MHEAAAAHTIFDSNWKWNSLSPLSFISPSVPQRFIYVLREETRNKKESPDLGLQAVASQK